MVNTDLIYNLVLVDLFPFNIRNFPFNIHRNKKLFVDITFFPKD